MNVLLYSYLIIMDCAINSPGHGKNAVDGPNANEKIFEATNGNYW